jgi:signal peptidase I
MVLVFVLLRTLIFQPFSIPSASDEPNFVQGDYIIVSKAAYGWSHHSIPLSPPLFSGRLFGRAPQRGDVVVFKLPRVLDGHVDYIKRLIGLPGDRVQMRTGRLYINGQALPEQPAPLQPPKGVTNDGASGQIETNPEGRQYMTQVYATGDAGEPRPNPNNTVEYVVPPHCYFVLGDNRDDSLDSRFEPELPDGDPKLGGCGLSNGLPSSADNPGVGFVPEGNLFGKAKLVLMSWDIGESDQDPGRGTLRPDRFFKVLH